MGEYKIINPSDDVRIDAPSDAVAVAAVCFIGEGRYAAEREGWAGPLFFFGGHEEWFQEHTGQSFRDFLAAHNTEIADSLKSARYARERTSMNRIVDRAHAIAEALGFKAHAAKDGAP